MKEKEDGEDEKRDVLVLKGCVFDEEINREEEEE